MYLFCNLIKISSKFNSIQQPSGHMMLEQHRNLVEIRSLRCSNLISTETDRNSYHTYNGFNFNSTVKDLGSIPIGVKLSTHSGDAVSLKPASHGQII